MTPLDLADRTIRAFIFDFNGVIVDDERLHFELFRDSLLEHGIALTELAYHERFLGYDDKGCFCAAFAEAGRTAEPALIQALIEEKAIRYAEAAATKLRFFPGARERIEECAADHPVAICSGALRAEIESALDALKVRSRIEAIIAAEDVRNCKPDPEGYVLAYRRLREIDADLEPEHCLAIEDSLAGVASARAAGMIACGIAHTYRIDELDAAGAHVALENLEMALIPELIARGASLYSFLAGLSSPSAARRGILISRDLFCLQGHVHRS